MFGNNSSSRSISSPSNGAVFDHRLKYGRFMRTSTDIRSLSNITQRTRYNISGCNRSLLKKDNLKLKNSPDTKSILKEISWSSGQSTYLSANRSNSGLMTSDQTDSDTIEELDINNNCSTLPLDDEVPMCYSYLRETAIHGLKSKKDPDMAFNELFDWWFYSFTYDMKWFLSKEWIRILIIFIFFIIFEISLMYYQYE